jgi:hypothetical protein
LLLPNAWDAMSARQFEAAGFGAIATTSGGLAWALGFPDGERAPWQEVVAATARINGANGSTSPFVGCLAAIKCGDGQLNSRFQFATPRGSRRDPDGH